MASEKRLITAYLEEYDWIMDHRKTRQRTSKGARVKENSCDVLKMLVDFYKSRSGESA